MQYNMVCAVQASDVGLHWCAHMQSWSTESCITLFQETDCKSLAKLTPHTDKHHFTIYINYPYYPCGGVY